MIQRNDEPKRDVGVFMMVVLIVAISIGYLFSRSRWLTSEEGAALMSRNIADARIKLVFGNFIININNPKSKL